MPPINRTVLERVRAAAGNNGIRPGMVAVVQHHGCQVRSFGVIRGNSGKRCRARLCTFGNSPPGIAGDRQALNNRAMECHPPIPALFVVA